MKHLLIGLLLAACSSPVLRPDALKADANLHRVDERLYRSEQPVANDLAALRALNIKSIVNLRYFNRRANHRLFAGHGIRLLNRPLLTWSVTPQDIAAVLHTIEVEQATGPVLVHCYHGADRTGTVVAMYRIIYQGWSIAAAQREMMHGGFGYHRLWKNLESLFTAEQVAAVRAELAKLRWQSL